MEQKLLALANKEVWRSSLLTVLQLFCTSQAYFETQSVTEVSLLFGLAELIEELPTSTNTVPGAPATI